MPQHMFIELDGVMVSTDVYLKNKAKKATPEKEQTPKKETTKKNS